MSLLDRLLLLSLALSRELGGSGRSGTSVSSSLLVGRRNDLLRDGRKLSLVSAASLVGLLVAPVEDTLHRKNKKKERVENGVRKGMIEIRKLDK